ncbi:hypothetical protein ZYGR_0A01140 [Zygosaccharomyces rouxii]|uniref:holo-[acyl-carrier-protein] synthase n=1 Tax=Zygosaccharomyces rouxii TaxID=4956 RepID=A0A1Q2ZSQ5_ZYGRO|nr:hypothetical protein ZYGR_0A01140 [Zygosaccharomyces rouxii]
MKKQIISYGDMQESIRNLDRAGNWHSILLLDSCHEGLQDAFVFEESMRFLSLEQQARILRKKSYPDRCKALCNRLLQISGISMATGLPHTQLKYKNGTYGKPQLKDIDGLAFSMSNGERYVAQYIVKGKHCEVGIDLASTADYSGDQDLNNFKEIFSSQEFESLIQCNPTKRAPMFAYIWSLKECYTKYTGLGLNSELCNIDFGKLNLFDSDNTLRRRIGGKEIWFYSHWITPNEVVTVCHESSYDLDQNPHLHHLTLQDVLKQLRKTR